MRIEFEAGDIEAIAHQVVEAMRPILFSVMAKQEDAVFDVQDLADYLKVHPSWIYKNGENIPHFKSGKYLRFRKSVIDKWIDKQTVRPSH